MPIFPDVFSRLRTPLVLLAVLFATDCAGTTQDAETLAGAKSGARAQHKKSKHAQHKRKSKSKVAKGESGPEPAPDSGAAAAKPAADTRPAQPERSRIVVPIKVALDALAQQIDALVPKTDQKDWTPITEGNDSPKAEIKYEIWRDPVDVTFSDHAFHVTVPVRYAANVRAQIKNPFKRHDWIWIAKNETWGTKEDPQRITAKIDAKIEIDGSWQVKSTTRLDDLEHGDAPDGKICKNAGIQICVRKAEVAPQVSRHIDAYLRPRLEKALAQVDAQVQHAFDLQQRAGSVWAALQAPQAVALPGSKEPAWLVVQPSAIGVSQPEMDGRALRVDLSVAGRIAVRTGDKPNVKPTPLPKLSAPEDPPGFHVNARLRVPADALSAALTHELNALRFAGNDKDQQPLSIAKVRVIAGGDDKHPHRIVVKLALDGALKAEIELRGDLAYDAATQRLSVEHFDFASDSEDLLKSLAGLDRAAMRKQIAARAHWDLAAEAAPLQRAISQALNATMRNQIRVSGALSELDVEDFALDSDALTADVIVGGTLEVEYTP